MTEYSEASEVRAVAEKDIIPRHHEWMEPFAIAYLFRSDWQKKGKTVWGEIKKATPLEKFLSGFDLIMTVNADVWPRLDHRQKQALVDHEFCHVTITTDEKTGEITLGLTGHDIEEFDAIVERYGAWKGDVERFIEAHGQYSLNLAAEPGLAEAAAGRLQGKSAKAEEEALAARASGRTVIRPRPDDGPGLKPALN